MNIIGHRELRQRLEKDLPNALLLIGQVGIGKKRLAVYLASRVVKDYDRIVLEGDIGIDHIRQVGQFVSTRPFGSPFKLVIIDTDGMSDSACQALLRMLEEASSRARFILVNSTNRLPLTILSRCMRMLVTPLEVREVQQVLEQLGFAKALAERAAQFSDGSVARAKEYLELQEIRNQVVSVASFMAERRVDSVIKNTRKWTDKEIVVLVAWFYDLIQVPYGNAANFTAQELASGAALPFSDIQRYLKVLDTPLRPSLKALYLAVRLSDNS